ncbi:MAG: hypothetical protein KAX13_00075, partial [Candidatus Krumholzibacteria bacterium]|nr:hypothetical protein [Candidatus Krumholzibacteria bacterium]
MTAILLLLPMFTAGFSTRAEEFGDSGEEERIPLGAGELSVELVSSPFDLIFLGQQNVPVQFSVANNSSVNIFVKYAAPIFSYSVLGDRMGDYEISGPLIPNLVIAPGAEHIFEFDVNVLPTALTGTPIRVDGAVLGVRLDNMETVVDSTATEPHEWVVMAEGVTAILSLFDTRRTDSRSDDSLLCQVSGEQFPLGTHHYLNNGDVLA